MRLPGRGRPLPGLRRPAGQLSPIPVRRRVQPRRGSGGRTRAVPSGKPGSPGDARMPVTWLRCRSGQPPSAAAPPERLPEVRIMGKKNKRAATGLGVGVMAGEILGNAAGELLADGAEKLLGRFAGDKGKYRRDKKGRDGQAAQQQDAGALLLLALEGRGSRRASDLLAGVAVRAGVSAAMQALLAARDLGLLRAPGKGGTRLRLTRLGRETAEALRACLAQKGGEEEAQEVGAPGCRR